MIEEKEFGEIVVGHYSPCIIEDIAKDDLIQQSSEIGLKFNGNVKLMFSLN